MANISYYEHGKQDIFLNKKNRCIRVAILRILLQKINLATSKQALCDNQTLCDIRIDYKAEVTTTCSGSLLSGALSSTIPLQSYFRRSSRDRCSTTPAPMESPSTLTVVRKRSLWIEKSSS